jgi:L,D-transpeptidase catalytic domain
MIYLFLFLTFLGAPKKKKIVSGKILRGSIRVYLHPRFSKMEYGKIRGSGYFKILKTGRKCRFKSKWYKIEGDAWVCSGWFNPSSKKPGNKIVWSKIFNPVIYYSGKNKTTHFAEKIRNLNSGKLRRVRKLRGFFPLEKVIFGSSSYYKLFGNGYVRVNSLKPYPRSSLRGVKVTKKGLPLVFVINNKANFYKKKSGKFVQFKPVAKYAVRSVKLKKGLFLPLKNASKIFLKKEDLVIAKKPPPPPKSVGKNENWVDVDKSQNIVYAMTGKKVIKVFLSSSSKETPVGLFRVYKKNVFQTFDRQKQKDAYYLQAVPYILYFKEGYAFHGAYWHNKFGKIQTHGCINLSILDAKWLFNFLGPVVPDGFISISSTLTKPGGLVRVRK